MRAIGRPEEIVEANDAVDAEADEVVAIRCPGRAEKARVAGELHLRESGRAIDVDQVRAIAARVHQVVLPGGVVAQPDLPATLVELAGEATNVDVIGVDWGVTKEFREAAQRFRRRDA
jgi:hypothetical protein